MEIVTAGVHDGDVASGVVFGVHFAGVGKTSFLFYGKGVEFSAKHDGGAGAIFQNGDYASAADSFGDFIAQTAQASGEFGGGVDFMR